MKYVEVALDELSHRGTPMKLKDLNSRGFLRANYRRSMWRSYFTFDEDLEAFLADKKALNSTFPGLYSIDFIRLDYEKEGDDGTHLGETQQYLQAVLRHMTENLDVQEDWIQVWFSGGKGFHVHLPNLFGMDNSRRLPLILRASIEKLLGDGTYLDLKPVGPAGLIRVEYSRHNRTGLYKVPLTLREFYTLSPDEIREIASDPAKTRQNFRGALFEDVEPVWRDFIVLQGKRLTFGTGSRGIAVQHDPTSVVTCMQKLLARGPVDGRRHKDLLRLASWMWRGGQPREFAKMNLIAWVRSKYDARSMSDAEIEHVVDQVYDARKYLYSCQDSVMSEFCDERCIFYKQKNYTVMLSDVNKMGKDYRAFLKKIHKQGLGIEFADLYPQWNRGVRKYRIVPGEAMIVTGDTGMMKTAWVQNLVVSLRQRIAWLNLEMAEHLVFRRFVQIAYGMSKHDVEHFFLHASEAEIEEKIGDLDFIQCLSISPTIEKVEQIIVQMEPQIVVIDTTDAIEVPEAGNNELYQLKRVTEAIRMLAQRYQIVIIGIHHISKKGSRDTTEQKINRGLTLNDLTGHRSNVTKMDHVFAITGHRDSPKRVLQSLKTRDGNPVAVPLEVDWATFRFSEPAVNGNPFS